MVYRQKLVFAVAICLLSVLGSNGVYAEESFTKSKSMISKSLAEPVDKIIQIMIYVDTQLLNEESIKRTEASGNYEAIAVLHRSLSDRELIDTQINQGRFEEAYSAMRAIVKRIKASTKLAWANEHMFKSAYDQIDSEHRTGATYFKRAQQNALALSDIF